mmetsp:Transcript_28747/g.39736  ORF Transcript_28747/g.39736 Transcript_28747/m.39736 type:complete len:245 (-) Transcript_28747:89-823(-)|eukprot:CAMPEP_0196584750 /NCGR_PEP_ID=MMETSP1081-20130531/48344_1 /TAXON_ID=36882 /ORGANISM="Pyramimonas amylifera, Strain CCMP720" /LENGTH=244 /DNA_ID=CAMNT_0041906077 /DNA_START=149 /DNA_END=883 /DNA_ORIENTATION=-
MAWGIFGGGKKEKEPESTTSSNSLHADDAPMGSQASFSSVRTPSDMFQGDLSSLSNLKSPALRAHYNPYEGLPSTLDPGMLEKLYNIPDTPEYLFSEESAVHRRSWSENLTYCTGVGYFGGALAGGVYGTITGLRSIPEGSSPDSTKLRANRILNAVSNRGTMYGNNIGCVGLFYAGLESLICSQRGVDDAFNSFLAGGAAGTLYKAVSGPRAMLVYGSAGALLFGTAATAKALYQGKPVFSLY